MYFYKTISTIKYIKLWFECGVEQLTASTSYNAQHAQTYGGFGLIRRLEVQAKTLINEMLELPSQCKGNTIPNITPN